MLEIKLDVVNKNQTELKALITCVTQLTSPRNQAYSYANIIKLAASRGMAGAGISSIKLELVKENSMAACKFFFRHCTEEADWQDVVAYAKDALACLVEDGEIKIYWLEDMVSKF